MDVDAFPSHLEELKVMSWPAIQAIETESVVREEIRSPLPSRLQRLVGKSGSTFPDESINSPVPRQVSRDSLAIHPTDPISNAAAGADGSG
ncbi:hypothetical protein AMTR_s00019p00191800 [Amborella trichopoda]|uniref:Uncharacterized protein n=1 Tax=Amborella trichopoda TaxID=13333 RepID=W1PJH8_AMBTC|nr:hypothetical protein AMTR_s00019p00191800 [Amborella trichopoda]